MADVLKANAASKNRALSITMQIKIIKDMGLSPAERQARLESLYAMADQLYGIRERRRRQTRDLLLWAEGNYIFLHSIYVSQRMMRKRPKRLRRERSEIEAPPVRSRGLGAEPAAATMTGFAGLYRVVWWRFRTNGEFWN